MVPSGTVCVSYGENEHITLYTDYPIIFLALIFGNFSGSNHSVDSDRIKPY